MTIIRSITDLPPFNFLFNNQQLICTAACSVTSYIQALNDHFSNLSNTLYLIPLQG